MAIPVVCLNFRRKKKRETQLRRGFILLFLAPSRTDVRKIQGI